MHLTFSFLTRIFVTLHLPKTKIVPLHDKYRIIAWMMHVRAWRQRWTYLKIRSFPYNTLNFNYPLFNIIYVLLNFHTSNRTGDAKKTKKLLLNLQINDDPMAASNGKWQTHRFSEMQFGNFSKRLSLVPHFLST